MKLKNINKTDLFVSPICMGTAMLGSTVNERESFDRLDAFFELGGNFLDTAIIYADWEADAPESASEKLIGGWMASRNISSEIVVATKGGHWAFRGETSGRVRLGREELCLQVEKSLENLQVSAIDIYYLHRDDISLPVEYIMDTLFENIDRGYIRYLGCSNWSVERLRRANEYAASCGRDGFIISSDRWSLAKFKPDKDPTIVAFDAERFDYIKEQGITEAPFQAIGKGALSRIAAGEMPRGDYDLPENYLLASRASEIARARGTSVGAISIAYLFSLGIDIIPTMTFSREEQIREAFEGAELRLTKEELSYLSI